MSLVNFPGNVSGVILAGRLGPTSTSFGSPIAVALGALIVFTGGCKKSEEVSEPPDPGVKIKLTSPAFSDGARIPKKYTSDGKGISPPLKWTAPPKDTVSLALICDDPDAPGKTFVHWVLFNLPASTRELKEGVPPEKVLPNGAKQGTNDQDTIGYGPPGPPEGETHRYFFKLYALDQVLDLPAGATKNDVLKAMKGHVLAKGQLMGKYGR